MAEKSFRTKPQLADPTRHDLPPPGAAIIGASLGSLPRLTSLELCDNFIQENAVSWGSMGKWGEKGWKITMFIVISSHFTVFLSDFRVISWDSIVI